MVTEDEKCLQGVLEEILDKISLSDNEFKETLNLYMSDKEYEAQIREAMEDASIDRQEGIPAHERSDEKPKLTIDRKEAIAA